MTDQSTPKGKGKKPAPAGVSVIPAEKVIYIGKNRLDLALSYGSVYSAIPEHVPAELHSSFMPVSKFGGKK